MDTAGALFVVSGAAPQQARPRARAQRAAPARARSLPLPSLFSLTHTHTLLLPPLLLPSAPRTDTPALCSQVGSLTECSAVRVDLDPPPAWPDAAGVALRSTRRSLSPRRA
jgi:hypothetical protein